MISIATTLAAAGAETISPGSLPLGEPRPMGDINSAMRDLDMTAARICELIEEGKLIGFNISTQHPGRAVKRVLTRSVEHYRQTGGIKPLVLEWPEIFRLILSHDKPVVTGTEISRCLNCHRTHVENLIRAGLVKTVRPSRQGQGGSAIITRESFENFLIGRLQ